ncbi:hypothetical protein [Pseudotabrizicola sp. L79]|uniref:hypothetical protein n=1 Tax=Pseudotabrizicola sp. L79 TaxID=3118402 RepID=UPI002F933D97
MSAVTIQQMADRVAEMMEQRLRIRGSGLEAKLRKGGRLLPRKVRLAAERLAEAAEKARNPKFLVQIDMARVAADYDQCVRHLASVTRQGWLKPLMISVAASVALGLLIVGAIWVYIQYNAGVL